MLCDVCLSISFVNYGIVDIRYMHRYIAVQRATINSNCERQVGSLMCLFVVVVYFGSIFYEPRKKRRILNEGANLNSLAPPTNCQTGINLVPLVVLNTMCISNDYKCFLSYLRNKS